MSAAAHRRDVTPPAAPRVATYLPRTAFAGDVQARVKEHFRLTGNRERDLPRMYLKTAVMMLWLGGSYAALVFLASSTATVVAAAISLGLAMAGVGFNVQHDGNHGAYSNRPWVNKVMSLSLDLMGGTAYYWHFKHNVAHHTHTNVSGHDDDINAGPLGRLSPHQRWYAAHRFQHFYFWGVYALLALEWQLTGEFRNLTTRRSIGSTKVPSPPPREVVIFWVGKVVFFGLAFALPLTRHPVLNVLGAYLVTTMTLGLVLAVVFQLAHCSADVDFRAVTDDDRVVRRSWAEHQVETTMDFGRGNRLLSWYVGGLNFQIEHHLFPTICHLNYPALAPIVEQTCRDHGVRYVAHGTFRSALAAHVRWLRLMGRKPAPLPAPVAPT
jgi:linoleoyl-CoA desaturase